MGKLEDLTTAFRDRHVAKEQTKISIEEKKDLQVRVLQQ
jgi:hypothetical protein